LVLSAGLVLLAALPLDRNVHVAAVILPAREVRAFAPEPAIVLSLRVKPGDLVEAGDILAQLFVPDIGHLQRAAQLRFELADGKLQRIAADAKTRAGLLVLEREKQLAEAELEGLRQRGMVLVLRAPLSGRVTGDGEPLREGQWVGRETLLFQIVDQQKARLLGLVLEREVARIAAGAKVRFVPGEGVAHAIDGVVDDIGMPGGEGVSLMYVASQYGGDIPTEPGRQGKPIAGYLPLAMTTEAGAGGRAMSGTAVVEAEPQSLLGFMAGRVATVMLRESGF
jgi:putative peptide zinc metalloprotease protein